MSRISVAPLTRIEGHGRVELLLEEGRLAAARILINESPRLFEGLLLGRDAAEVPSLVCRICAICSTVHRIAACQALEQALAVSIPPRAALIRELALLGGHIESHALHLFCLVYPDLVNAPSILDPLRQGDPIAREGLALKALGNRMQTLAGGRKIHPVNIEIGGVLHTPAPEELADLLGGIEKSIAGIGPVTRPFFQVERWPRTTPACGVRIAVTTSDGKFTLTGDRLLCSDGTAIPAADYRDLLQEVPLVDSNARQSRKDGASLLCGALARAELSTRRHPATSPLSHGIYGNNAAQALELSWALRRGAAICRQLLAEPTGALCAAWRPGPGSGTAAIEAPRGLLLHHYILDDMGRVGAADIITPTAINTAAMEEQLLADLTGVTEETELRGTAEQIIRAYDPCISCSVHLVSLR